MTNLPSSNIALGALKESDADLMCRWRNDWNLCKLLTATPLPVTNEATLNWIRSMHKNECNIALGIYNADELKGIFRLMNIDWIARVAELGIYIGDSKDRHKGYGRDGINLGLQYGFGKLNLAKIWLRVLSTNTTAQNLYESLGFEKEGVLKQHYYADGEHHDVTLFSLFARNYRTGAC